MSDTPQRPQGEWPGWMDELLRFGPIAELEYEWKASIGDAITAVLDARAAARSTHTERERLQR